MTYTGAPRRCSEKGCSRRVKARGLCGTCYKRYRDQGRAMPSRIVPAGWVPICQKCLRMLTADDFTRSMRRNGGWCKECVDLDSRSKYDAKTARAYHLRRKYKLTPDDVMDMIVRQDGCAICHTKKSTYNGWHVDHDHSCCPVGHGEYAETCGNCIRGILCHHCNLMLGNAQDNPNLLRRAAEYLEAS